MNSLTCVICNSNFTSKRSDTKYCSEKCKTRAETISRQKRIESNRTILSKKCMVCNDEFYPNKRNPYQIYCSKNCLNKAMNSRAVDSGRKKEWYYKNKDKYYFKKRETDNKHKDVIRFGGNKEKVLKRDNNKCVKCGSDDQIIIHHKDHSGSSSSPNNSMDNLETLCRSCHAKHHELGTIVREAK